MQRSLAQAETIIPEIISNPKVAPILPSFAVYAADVIYPSTQTP